MFFEQYSHEPYIAVNRHLLLHSSPVELERLDDRIAANHTRGEQALAVMEQRLDGNDWLAAGQYTIADIALYAYTHTAAEGGFDLAPYRGIRAWLDRVRTQPGHIPQMEEEAGVAVVNWPG
jgi:glutathione S-transferase